MLKYTDFTEMNVWKMAMAIAVSVFKLTDSLPRKEDYGLTSQIRRSATSISANIAEAFGRATSADKRKFYDYAEVLHLKLRATCYMDEKLGTLVKTKLSN